MSHVKEGGGGRGGRGTSRGHGRGRQRFNKTLVECYKCHKLRHFQYECPSWEKGAHYAEVNEDKEILLLMTQVNFHNSQKEATWFLDSSCNNHMTGHKKWFLHLDETLRQDVKLGNNTKMAVMGKGSIKLRVNAHVR